MTDIPVTDVPVGVRLRPVVEVLQPEVRHVAATPAAAPAAAPPYVYMATPYVYQAAPAATSIPRATAPVGETGNKCSPVLLILGALLAALIGGLVVWALLTMNPSTKTAELRSESDRTTLVQPVPEQSVPAPVTQAPVQQVAPPAQASVIPYAPRPQQPGTYASHHEVPAPVARECARIGVEPAYIDGTWHCMRDPSVTHNAGPEVPGLANARTIDDFQSACAAAGLHSRRQQDGTYRCK